MTKRSKDSTHRSLNHLRYQIRKGINFANTENSEPESIHYSASQIQNKASSKSKPPGIIPGNVQYRNIFKEHTP